MRLGTRRNLLFAFPLKRIAHAWQAQVIFRVETSTTCSCSGSNSALHISQRSTAARCRTNRRRTENADAEFRFLESSISEFVDILRDQGILIRLNTRLAPKRNRKLNRRSRLAACLDRQSSTLRHQDLSWSSLEPLTYQQDDQHRSFLRPAFPILVHHALLCPRPSSFQAYESVLKYLRLPFRFPFLNHLPNLGAMVTSKSGDKAPHSKGFAFP